MSTGEPMPGGNTAPVVRVGSTVFCQEYGAEPAEVVEWAIARLDDLIAYSLEQAAAGVASFIRTNAEGHLTIYRTDVDWLRSEWLL